MPWMETEKTQLRKDFVSLASKAGANVSELARRFNVSAPTAYKWLRRHREMGDAGLEDRSRRPVGQPTRTSVELEAKVVTLRLEYPYWGARKLRRLLLNAGESEVPSSTTVHNVLRRHGLVEARRPQASSTGRFERSAPNELWQMDFKGHFAAGPAARCHPFTMCDDHSRFNLALRACEDERLGTVRDCLLAAFRSYGIPNAILCDNGAPWGRGDGIASALELWLLRVGVDVLHGRAYHPQTQGKEERFHRTLDDELLRRTTCWNGIEHCSKEFSDFRHRYNHVRPHHSLDGACPAERYVASARALPSPIPCSLSFLSPGDETRRVRSNACIMFRNRTYFLGRGFVGEHVSLKRCSERRWEVFYCWKGIGVIDLAVPALKKHRIEPLLAWPGSLGSRAKQEPTKSVNHVS